MTFLLALLLALLPSPPTGGTFDGRVVLLRSGAPVPDASNAVVWIEGARGGGPARAEGQMKSEQKRFTPRVVLVRPNATVQFPNADSIYHNAFSVSGANRFDLGLYRSGASREKKFEEPGLVRVYCNIHPQMIGFVMVVDSAFAAVTGPARLLRAPEDLPRCRAADLDRRRQRDRRLHLPGSPRGRRQDRRGPEEVGAGLGIVPAEPLRRAPPRARRPRQQSRDHRPDDTGPAVSREHHRHLARRAG